MQGKILIIEDDKELSDIVLLYLDKEGFEVRAAESAEYGFTVMETWTPELIILDINLPGMDGLEFLREFCRTNNTPILIISARDSDEDMIAGLSIGADEFVTKPFSPKVLVARVRALFRRIRGIDGSDTSCCRFGPFVLDYGSCVLKKDGQKIALSPKEFDCLAFLSENPGKTFTPEAIYTGVWKNNYGDLTTVTVHIQRLRRKIEEDPTAPVYIETVYGKGYRFSAGKTTEK
ncbi:MAG: response regulator transcription factor [Treponema sp.]|jgi:two-component system response regulator RegX3|nr:response regulator transcription factor [Treponema sp.]